MKIAICTPVHGDPAALYTNALAAMLIRTARDRPDLELRYILSRGHLLRNRNTLADAALQWGADFTLWIDADMAFPDNTLTALLAHGLPVVGCNSPTRDKMPRPTAFKQVGDQAFSPVLSTPVIAQRSPLEEVTHIGLGVALIAVPIFCALDRPIFYFSGTRADPRYEDSTLCDNIRANGTKIFVDHALSLRIGHVGETVFTNADAAKALTAN